VLVTGSNGFIGAKVVETLLEYGYAKLRCFVRPASSLARLQNVLNQFSTGQNVELIAGDLLSRDDCRKAAEGVAIVYHLAAGIEKSFAGAFMNSALTTRNLMDAFLHHGEPKRFVNVSSFSVYSNLTSKRGALLDESHFIDALAEFVESGKIRWLLHDIGSIHAAAEAADGTGAYQVRVAKHKLIHAQRRCSCIQESNVPNIRCDKPPSAELRPDQTDQDSLPPYDVLDAILEEYVVRGMSAAEIIRAGFDESVVKRVVRLIDGAEYKRRQAAPGLKVTSKAFGVGRRIPIAQRYREG
jgi:hypothetical protein